MTLRHLENKLRQISIRNKVNSIQFNTIKLKQNYTWTRITDINKGKWLMLWFSQTQV